MKLSLATLPRVNVALMVVLTLATLGVYFPLWYLRRLHALNALRSPVKVGPILPVVVLVLYIPRIGPELLHGIFVALGASALTALASGTSTVLGLAQGVLLLVLAFQVKEILEDHLRVSLAGVWTFLFNAYYLQSTINEHQGELAGGNAPATTDSAETA
jgi:hypothetical protein